MPRWHGPTPEAPPPPLPAQRTWTVPVTLTPEGQRWLTEFARGVAELEEEPTPEAPPQRTGDTLVLSHSREGRRRIKEELASVPSYVWSQPLPRPTKTVWDFLREEMEASP